MQDFISQVEFVTPPPDFPLCQKPAQPQLIEAASGNPVTSLTFCQGDSKVILIQQDSLALSYDVYLDGNLLYGAITTPSFTVSAPGTYMVVAKQYSCHSDASAPLNVNVISPPGIPIVQWDHLTGLLTCQVNLNPGDSLQWYYEGQPIPGATGLTFQPTQNGEYYVVVWNPCGQNESNHYQYVITKTDFATAKELRIDVYPNPFVNEIPVIYLDLPQESRVSANVYDLLGKQVLKVFEGTLKPGHHEIPIYGEFAQTTYLLQIQVNGQSKTFKLQHIAQ
jgi:hypothetical protein